MNSKFQYDIHDPRTVLMMDDTLVIRDQNGKTYKIIKIDGSTITYQLGFWERVKSSFWSFYWKTIDFIDEVMNVIRAL